MNYGTRSPENLSELPTKQELRVRGPESWWSWLSMGLWGASGRVPCLLFSHSFRLLTISLNQTGDSSEDLGISLSCTFSPVF